MQKGQKAFYIMAPVLVNKKEDQNERGEEGETEKEAGQQEGRGAEESADRVQGGSGVRPGADPKPAEDWQEEKRYHPFGEGKGTVRVSTATSSRGISGTRS